MMNILTLEDKSFSINEIGIALTDGTDNLEKLDPNKDIHFCVLDNSVPAEADYYFPPLIYLETFNSPGLVLRIGNQTIKMPVSWSILVGDKYQGNLEVLPLTSSLDARDLTVFCYNPLSSFKAEFEPIQIINIYSDIKWFFPKLNVGQLLAIPLTDGDKPQCAYFVKEISRQSEIVDLGEVVQ